MIVDDGVSGYPDPIILPWATRVDTLVENHLNSGNWLAIDWGTSSLRVWLMSDANDIVDRAASNSGMGKLEPSEFEPALLRLVDQWLREDTTTHAIACGMVGAKQGWIEAPYLLRAPCQPMDATSMIEAPVQDSRLKMRIVPGISQHHPADVMRGEETQIAGFLCNAPEFRGCVCLPGTHSKWAQISDGLIAEFTTYMTGELYAVLSSHSVLRHSMAPRTESGTETETGSGISAQTCNDVFINSVAKAFKSPQGLTCRLFGLRAESLLNNMSPGEVQSSLSGYLIGQELSNIKKLLDQASADQQPVILIGDKKLTDRYALAIGSLSYKTTVCDAELMSVNGLAAARSIFFKTS